MAAGMIGFLGETIEWLDQARTVRIRRRGRRRREIDTRAKCGAGAGQYDDANTGIVVEIAERLGQGRASRVVDGVALFRAVQHQPRNGAVNIDLERAQ